MQQTSAIWKQLWAAGAALETRAVIAGTVYNDISAPVIVRAAMQDRLGIGNVAAASLTLTVRGAATIPRSAAVVIETRLNDGETASEWLPQGTFYIARRARDPVTGAVALECYDALLKANAVWEPSAGSWPRAMSAVLTELLALLGLMLDSRTSIPSGIPFVIAEPAAGATIRDALGIIAQAGGGNWIVTPENRLRLVPLADAAAAAETVADAVDVDGVTGGMSVETAGTVTGIRGALGEDSYLIGDDTGIVVDVSVASVIAVELAAALIGRRYQAYNLTGAVCDPAAELGDYVRAGAGGEVASALYNQQITLGPACRSDISAPQAGEVTDEYPYIGGSAKTLALAKAYVNEAVEALDSDLTQQEIFNRLTDDGAAQGLVLLNGQLYINASYINAGMLSVGRIGFNDVEGHYSVPNENDPASLLPGEAISGGWIVSTDSTNQIIRLLGCDYAVPLRGQTITLTFTYKTRIENGVTNYRAFDPDDGAYGESEEYWFPETEPPYVPPNPCTYTYTVPNDAENLEFWVYGCDGVKNISVSVSGTPITPPTIKFDYSGLRIGDLLINRDGNVILDGYFHISKPICFSNDVTLYNALSVGSGGTGATNAANARANLGVSPYYYIRNAADTKRLQVDNDTVNLWTNSGVGNWTAKNIINSQGIIPVSAGGTAATNAADARTNLGITPASIGAVSKNGDTINGDLTVKGNLYMDSADYAAIGDLLSNALIAKTRDGTVFMQSSGYASVYVYDDGDALIQSESGAASIRLSSDGDINVSGDMTLNNPLEVQYGGTGASNAAGARTNLGITTENIGPIANYYQNDSNEHSIGKFGSYTLYRKIFTKNGYSDNAETYLGGINGTVIRIYGVYIQNDGSRVAANHYYDGSSYSSLWVGSNNGVYGRGHPAGTHMRAIVEYYR